MAQLATVVAAVSLAAMAVAMAVVALVVGCRPPLSIERTLLEPHRSTFALRHPPHLS